MNTQIDSSSTTDDPVVTCDHPSGYQRPQFNIQFLLQLTVAAALWMVLFPFVAWGSRAVAAVIALTFLFGCWRTRRSLLVLLPCLYLPYSWLVLLTNYSWNDYRWHWIGMWLQLPGFIAELPFHPVAESWFQLVTGLATCAILLTLVTLGRISTLWLVGTAIGTTLVFSFLSAFTYGLFRM